MSRNACNGENGETGDLNWMPKVAKTALPNCQRTISNFKSQEVIN